METESEKISELGRGVGEESGHRPVMYSESLDVSQQGQH